MRTRSEYRLAMHRIWSNVVMFALGCGVITFGLILHFGG